MKNHTKFQDLSSLKVGDELMVHAYKLNGWLYRSWNNPKVVSVEDDLLILCSTNSLVITSEEKSIRNFPSWTSKMSYWFFFKNEWFNVIATIEKEGIKFYINIASPFIYEEHAIKYYDFDLDFKVTAEDKWKQMDLNEYIENSKKYNYPQQLLNKIATIEKKVENYILNGYFRKMIDNNLIIKLFKKLPITPKIPQRYNAWELKPTKTKNDFDLINDLKITKRKENNNEK